MKFIYIFLGHLRRVPKRPGDAWGRGLDGMQFFECTLKQKFILCVLIYNII